MGRTPTVSSRLVVDVQHQDAEEMLNLEGDLCFANVPLFERETFYLRWSPYRSVLVDLQRLDFLDCAGLRALVDLSNQVAARGGRLTVTRPNGIAAKMIRLVGPPEWNRPHWEWN